VRLITALIGSLVLAGCVQALPDAPKSVFVAAALPANWPQPHAATVAAPPEIQAVRLSSLDARPGTTWDGDVVTSTNTASLEFATNLFNFSAPRSQPGHFHFTFRLVDIPGAMVRTYILHIIARNTAGESRQIDVPFRLSGRRPASAFNAAARATATLGAPPLVDMNGESVDLQSGVSVLAFIYTRCPDPRMCPLVTAKFARMARLLAGTPVRLVEITLDPTFDTPAVLRAYGRAAGADGVRWTLATGEPGAIAAFAERAGLAIDRPRPGLVLHTEAVLIARDGILERNIAGNDWTAAEVAAESRSIEQLPADPLARFGLRLVGGVVEMCGAASARGFSPILLLSLVGAILAVGALLFAGRRRIWTRLARR
jgi:cytochrome oxidase Cu insertion factor (SCO1/SenC/PrrC family)